MEDRKAFDEFSMNLYVPVPELLPYNVPLVFAEEIAETFPLQVSAVSYEKDIPKVAFFWPTPHSTRDLTHLGLVSYMQQFRRELQHKVYQVWDADFGTQ
jgi:hypothetical protein